MGNKNRYGGQQTGKFKFRGLWLLGILAYVVFAIATATENYSEGERIGFITKFSHKGRFWKSWEGELNLTQTGMNTSSLFDFSIDNDNESGDVVAMIDSAVNNGWKVKLTYHQTYFKNWFSNRGDTDYFVKSVQVLDRQSPGNNQNATVPVQGKVIDTIYVVIDKSQLRK
ncbi:MAG TPA: hypothetical protein PLU53_01330 [Bacteroidia bacterium]|nr:hypothetical protein [Bacteroidia bacterium]